METVGLIAAMPSESKALLRWIKPWRRVSFGRLKGARFIFGERECWLVTTGMGLKCAEEGTRALLAEISPQLLISFGIAGAVQEDLRIGDVIVAVQSFLLDKGMLGQPQPLVSLSDAAWEAASQALLLEDARVVAGTAITTRGSQVVGESLENVAHPILEMETAGIARVASEFTMPLLSIRSISDSPKAPIPVDIEKVIDENGNYRIGKMLCIIARNPLVLFHARQMVINSGKASRHAAKAVITILNQPAPIITSEEEISS